MIVEETRLNTDIDKIQMSDLFTSYLKQPTANGEANMLSILPVDNIVSLHIQPNGLISG